MTDAGDKMLRVYCICGQKMRVSQSMYGKNGKCIACRQKIRIPEAKELSADVLEIHLRDHPEFLRKAVRAKALTEPPAEAPRDEVPLGDDTVAIVPIDPLESLRILCSFDEEIGTQIDALKGKNGAEKGPVGEATLEGYRVLIQNIRSDLDDQLREELTQVSKRLDESESQIARASLNARAGELRFVDFAKIVGALRQRREFLARRRHNLRGWLATTDPRLAGGRLAVRFEDIPCERIALSLPPAPKDDLPLPDQCLEALREAMTTREEADRKIAAWKRMEEEETLPDGTLEASLDAHRAVRGRARAAVAYHRQRLNQVIKDCDNDIKAVKGDLETLRTSFQDGQLGKAEYQTKETDLMRLQADMAKARDMAREALRAERSAALPPARKSYIKRAAKQQRGDGLGRDCLAAWLAAALMLLNITIDLVPGQLAGNMVEVRNLSLVLFAAAIIIAVLPVIPRRKIRGGAYMLVAMVYLIAAAACLEDTYHGQDRLGGALRTVRLWFLSPGVLLIFVSYVLAQLAAVLALQGQDKNARNALWWSPAIGMVAVAFVGLSGFGLYAPHPKVLRPEPGLYQPTINGYATVFTLENDGVRPFWYGGTAARLPRPVHLELEQEFSPGNWQAVSGPWPAMRHSRWSGFRAPEAGIAVDRNGYVKLRRTLQPGSYRYRLNDPMGRGAKPFEVFELPAGGMPEPNPNDGTNIDPVPVMPTSKTISIRLRGFADPKKSAPLCYFVVTPADGAEVDVNIRLGAVLAGPWKLAEYNPERRSVTLSDGQTFLLMRTGETLDVVVPVDTKIPPDPEPVENDGEAL